MAYNAPSKPSTLSAEFKYNVAYQELQKLNFAEDTAHRAQPGATDLQRAQAGLTKLSFEVEETAKRFGRINKILRELPGPKTLVEVQVTKITELESELVTTLHKWLYEAEGRIPAANDHAKTVNKMLQDSNDTLAKSNAEYKKQIAELRAKGSTNAEKALKKAYQEVIDIRAELIREKEEVRRLAAERTDWRKNKTRLFDEKEEAKSKVRGCQAAVDVIAQERDKLRNEDLALKAKVSQSSAASAAQVAAYQTEAARVSWPRSTRRRP
jgi:chromosome segregation ATPase